jgi:hypothetical protein
MHHNFTLALALRLGSLVSVVRPMQHLGDTIDLTPSEPAPIGGTTDTLCQLHVRDSRISKAVALPAWPPACGAFLS